MWFLLGLSAAISLGALSYVLLGLPPELSQGWVQKIFYFHVPSAFSMYLFLIIGAALSIYYLFDRNRKYDLVAQASMYTATFFGVIVIVSGPIWAKPIWGVYWTWDPRLTTTFIIFVLLVAYAAVRKVFKEKEGREGRGPIVGAILAIFALLDVPLIHFSVKIWRGLHPSVLNNSDGLTPEFQRGLEGMILSSFALGGLFCLLIYNHLKSVDRVERLEINQLKEVDSSHA